MESCDLPEKVSVDEVTISQLTKFDVRHGSDLLAACILLEADVIRRPAGDWSSKLYRPLPVAEAETRKTRFVPYFAWANRGESEMTVWLPLNHSPPLAPDAGAK